MRLLGWLLVATSLVAADHFGLVRCGGEPVAGAVVTAVAGETRVTTTTDEVGRYVMRNVNPGRWEMSVRLVGFKAVAKAVVIEKETETLEWRLEVDSPEDPKEPLATVAAAPQKPERPTESSHEDLSSLASEAGESVLVSGSLSRGLEFAARDDELNRMRNDWVKDADKGPPLPGAPKPEKQLAGVEGRFEAPGEFAGFGGPGPGGPAVPKPKPEPKKKEAKGPKGAEPGVSVFGNRMNRWRDKVHGSFYSSVRNAALDARPYAINSQPVERAPYSQLRAGFAIGGPLVIPKIVDMSRTFFFASYSTTRSSNPYFGMGTLPGPSLRAGDLHESGALVYDPLSGLPFPDNRIPESRISRASRGLLQYIPLPNQAGGVRNYQAFFSVPQNRHDVSTRINHSISGADHLDASVALQTSDSQNAQLFGFRDSSEGLGMSAGLSWLHSLGGKSVNNLRLSFSRNRTQLIPFFAFGRDVGGDLGIQGTSQNPVNFGPPNLSFTNFAGLSDGSALLRRDQALVLNETLKWHQEVHKIDAGVEVRRTHSDTITDQNARGTYTFTGLATSAFDATGQPLVQSGFDFADFLLGLPQSGSIRFGGSDNYFRGWIYSAYVQDDWKPLVGLSLKYGVRYEYFVPPVEKYGRMTNLDIAPGFTAVTPVQAGGIGPYNGQFPAALIDADRNNLSPRIGLAWRPIEGSKFHIRAGYGVFFDGSTYQRFPAQLSAQPPFARTNIVNSTPERPLTIETGFTGGQPKAITNTFAVDRSYRAGYAQTWNLSIKHDLAHHIGFELGYLGTKGTRLDIQRLPNRAVPGSPLTSEQRRLIGNAVGFTFESSEGSSIFHAAQFKFIRHFQKVFAAEMLYTFAKSIDNASTLGGGGGTIAQDDRNLRAERGLSCFDQRHRAGFSYLWNSPLGDTGSLLRGSDWKSLLFGNWMIGGTILYSSGTPFTARVLGNRSDSGGTGAIGAGRADATGLPIGAGAGFFNLLAFGLPPGVRFGNAARNSIPGIQSLVANLALARSFRLGDDRRRMELRAESANFTNHVNISGIGTVVNASEYGLATAAQPMRTLVLHLRVRF
ncbi:MAG: TonB-dependent receptor [Acidobacteria bacterium]|nr:TonB-dependent receptor [Acidobacteriota bacterium]